MTARRLATTLLLPLLGALAGCNVIGAVAYKAIGEPDVPAEYELGQKKTVVLVENYRNPDLAAEDAELVARLVQAKLSTRQLTRIVGYEKVLELKARKGREFRQLSVPEIADEVGAEQVLYVHFESGGASSMGGGSVLQGRASVLVRLIDGKTGNNLWPQDISDGRAVHAETAPTNVTDKVRPQDIRSKLYDTLSTNVVRLFHSWKPDSGDPQG